MLNPDVVVQFRLLSHPTWRHKIAFWRPETKPKSRLDLSPNFKNALFSCNSLIFTTSSQAL